MTASSTNTSWRIRVSRWAGHLVKPFEVLVRIVRVFELAIPIGLLRRDDIVNSVRQAYEEVPDFYHPDTYPIRYEEQLVPMLDKLLDRDKNTERRLLDLYCGHGREAEIFARAGFAVTAVDEQSEVIKRAQAYADKAGFTADFIAADVTDWNPGATTWDVVYTSLWMYSTIPDRVARLAWLRHLSRWVGSGGILVVSVTPGTNGAGMSLKYGIARLLATLTFNSRRPERGDRFQSGLFWHDFTDEEIAGELQAAQMQIVDGLKIDGGTPCHFYLLRMQ